MPKVGDAYIEIHPDLDNFAAAMRSEVTPMLQAAGDRDGKTYGKRVSLGFGNAFTSGIAATLGRTALQWGTMAAMAGPAAAAINGLAGATTALAAGLVQAAGGAAGVIPVMGSLGQAAGTVMIGMQGVSDAFKETAKVNAKLAAGLEPTESELANMRQTMKSLTPEARAFVKATMGLSKEWGKVRQSVQGALFAGLADDIKGLAKTYLPILNRNLTESADILNNVARGMASWLQQRSTAQKFNNILGTHNTILETLGQAVQPFANALLNLYTTILPLGVRLSQSIRDFAIWLNKAVSTNMGGLSEWFNQAWEAASSLANTVKWLIIGLARVFAAGQTQGRGMLDTIEGLAKKFADWTGSMQGQATLKAWFAEGKQVFTQLIGLVGDLGKAFGGLAGTADPSEVVGQLRKAAQVLGEILTNLNASGHGQQLITQVTLLTEKIGKLGIFGAGALVGMLTTFNLLLTPVVKLAGIIPGFSKAVTGLFVAFGAYKAISMTTQAVIGFGQAIGNTASAIKTGITNVAAFGQGLRNAQSGMSAFASTAQRWGAIVGTNVRFALAWAKSMALSTAAVVKNTAATVASWTAQKAAALWTKVVTAAQWLWNAAMTANPIGLIIVGIAALIAAFVLLYKKVGWFRAGVNAAWNGIKVAAKAAWNVIKVVVKVAITLITGYIKTWIKVVKAVIKTGMAIVKAIFRGDWRAVYDILRGILQNLVAFVRGIWDKIVSGVKSAGSRLFSAAKAAGSKLLDGIVNTFRTVVGKVRDILSDIRGAISGIDLYQLGKDMITGFINGVGSMASALINKVEDVIGGAKAKAKSLLGIGSPSKVFRGYGKDTGRGFAIGIVGTKREVQRATDRIMPTANARLGAMGGGAFGAMPGAGGPTQVRVFIGDREITDIVRVEVRKGNQRTASRIARGRRAV